MVTPAPNGVGNGLVQATNLAHSGFFDAIVKFQRPVKFFSRGVQFGERAHDFEIVRLGFQAPFIFAINRSVTSSALTTRFSCSSDFASSLFFKISR